MHAKQDKPQNAAEVLKFFDWAFKNGQKMAEELDYVPMPDARDEDRRGRLEGADQGRVRQAGLELGVPACITAASALRVPRRRRTMRAPSVAPRRLRNAMMLASQPPPRCPCR